LAQTFTDSDWDFLLDTALLHSEMWNGETKLAAEIRLRVSAFGSTPEARLRLRLKIDDEAAEVAQTVNMDAERRKRLKAIAD
jgi:plasmid maintenance system antidote protein VapI